jgi:hypothetical protein
MGKMLVMLAAEQRYKGIIVEFQSGHFLVPRIFVGEIVIPRAWQGSAFFP